MTRTILLAFAALILPTGTANAQNVSGEIDLLEMHIGSGDDHFVFDGELQIGGERHAATFKLDGGSDVGPRIDEVTA